MTQRIATCVFNEYCGHGRILRQYMGVEGFVPIAGRIQHGWSARQGGMPDDRLSNSGPLYFWSQRAADGWQADRPDYRGQATAIGAPFLYAALRVSGPGDGLLVFPAHGIVGQPLDDSAWPACMGGIERTAAQIGATRVTVCLYDLDYREGLARSVIESAGFDAVTAGSPWTPGFLERLVKIIGDRAVVAASWPCTALFYALALDRPCFIVPDALRPIVGDEWTDMLADPVWGRARFPHLYGEPTRGVYWREELGADAVLSPGDLFTTLYADREVVAC